MARAPCQPSTEPSFQPLQAGRVDICFALVMAKSSFLDELPGPRLLLRAFSSRFERLFEVHGPGVGRRGSPGARPFWFLFCCGLFWFLAPTGPVMCYPDPHSLGGPNGGIPFRRGHSLCSCLFFGTRPCSALDFSGCYGMAGDPASREQASR